MPKLGFLLFLSGSLLSANDRYPQARFTDSQRKAKLMSAMPAVDEVFRRFAASQNIPGMAWGVVVDERLAHVGTVGLRDRESGAPVAQDTVFRIASMTKSFTALAVLKLRDEGKLSLEDPVAKWIPEFSNMPLPTRDSAPLVIRELLSHSAGLPEDNPWGDRQLADSETDLTRMLLNGISFSTPPDTRYEYSNLAFALLGRVVAKASGVPYSEYLQREILDKLNMRHTTLEFTSVPAEKRATGYRLLPGGTYQQEPPLPQGAFGSMGGLLTDAADLGRWVAFQLSAWPARDEAEAGPVRRSSVREMNHLWRPANLNARRAPNGRIEASSSGYGYGLRISSDCRFEQISAHGGGLPGFGSYMLWLPDYGVGLFAMTNLTYSGPSAPIHQALDVFLQSGGLQKREMPAPPMLLVTRERIASLWKNWSDKEAERIAAVNLFLDKPIARRREEMRVLKEQVGACGEAGPLRAENWLRGQFNITCDKGNVGAFFTMSPTTPPRVQYLEFRKLHQKGGTMTAPTGAPASVSCSE